MRACFPACLPNPVSLASEVSEVNVSKRNSLNPLHPIRMPLMTNKRIFPNRL